MNEKNEKNETVNENGTESKAIETLKVERAAFTAKDGREMWSYMVNGNVRGKATKVDLIPYDQGGYEVLDMIFNIKDYCDLIVHEESMIDSVTGEARQYVVYEVMNIDEDGDPITCRIKPSRDSDKSILAYLLKKLNRQSSHDNT